MGGLAGTVTDGWAAMTTADSFRVTVMGQGSHGSMPEHSIDPIVLGAAMVMRLQTVVSQGGPAVGSCVSHHRPFNGLKENVIPDRAVFTINVRTFDPKVRRTVLDSLRRIIAHEALASGAPEPVIEDISISRPYYNDPEKPGSSPSSSAGNSVQRRSCKALGDGQRGFRRAGISDRGAERVLVLRRQQRPGNLAAGAPPANHSPFFAPITDPTLATGVRAAVRALYSKVGQQ